MKAFVKPSLLAGVLLALVGCSMQPTEQQNAMLDDSANETEQAVIPQSFVDDYQQALSALTEENYDSAETALLSLIEAYPQYSGPWVNLAIVYAHTGREQDAVQSLQTALQINPANVDALNLLAIEYRKAGDFPAAEQLYLLALKQVPDDAASHLNLAILYDLYLGQWDQALTHYQSYKSSANDAADPRIDGWIVDLQRRMQQEVGLR